VIIVAFLPALCTEEYLALSTKSKDLWEMERNPVYSISSGVSSRSLRTGGDGGKSRRSESERSQDSRTMCITLRSDTKQ
jgi:hypothetical protein